MAYLFFWCIPSQQTQDWKYVHLVLPRLFVFGRSLFVEAFTFLLMEEWMDGWMDGCVMMVASLGRVCEAEIMMMLIKCRTGIQWRSWQRLAEVAQLAPLAGWLTLDHAQMPINCPADDTPGA